MSDLLADVDEGFKEDVRITEDATQASRQNMAPLGGPVQFMPINSGLA